MTTRLSSRFTFSRFCSKVPSTFNGWAQTVHSLSHLRQPSRLTPLTLTIPHRLSLHISRMSSSGKQPSKPSMRRLVNFYDPATKGPDAHGRTLDDILEWSDDKLESQHNYIQTVFPLPEGSGFGHLAPIIDEETMLLFRQSSELRRNLLRALKRMLAFYGFHAEDKEGDEFRLIITPKRDCEAGFSRWVVRLDHNHLRITRILRSLRVLGLEGAARDFYDALIEVCKVRDGVGSSSIGYWTRALEKPLRYAPDGTEVAWLEKY
ncbi:opioid growth factor receptor conserved region-domain-containing protein [Xylaria sp. FL0043]|nr:opioid growth factor receptor conserved region-domain-containing protein [Xylaria sp. FL0043]